MTKPDRRTRIALIVTVTLVVFAYVLRALGMCDFYSHEVGVARSFIYIGIFTVWGMSLRNRIIQTQVRRYMTAAAVLMVFWFVVRTLKYNFIPVASHPDLVRYIWYMYYLPMIFIPTLAVLIALSIGRPDGYRLTLGTTAPLYFPAGALLLMVITNDLHQKVFIFPPDAEVWTDKDYGYGKAYYIVFAWILLCAVLTLAVLYGKCRIPGSRRRIMFPCIPIVVLLLYCILYYAGVEWFRFIAGDTTTFFCLSYAAYLEICIQCRFIQSNTRYRQLFDASTVKAQITDDKYQILLSSRASQTVSTQLLMDADKNPVMLEGGIRLCSAPIHKGHFYWQEDVSKLLSVLEELSSTREELQEYGVLLREENKQKQRHRRLEEQKRLFETVQKIISPSAEHLMELLEELKKTDDKDKARELQGRICVIGAYIKRRSNIVFLADKSREVAAEELALCLRESISYLQQVGIPCALNYTIQSKIGDKTAGMFYDFFETALERVWEKISQMNVVATENETSLRITIMTEYTDKLRELEKIFPCSSVEEDEGVCYCTLTVPKEGERP